MTQKQRIEELEAKVAALEARLAVQEARPYYVPYYPQPYTAPVYPWQTTWTSTGTGYVVPPENTGI